MVPDQPSQSLSTYLTDKCIMADQPDPSAPEPVYDPGVDPDYDPDALPGLDNPDEPVVEPGEPDDALSDKPTRAQA